MALKDICGHQLKLVYDSQYGNNTNIRCEACQEPPDAISDFLYYICTTKQNDNECNYFMHKLCAELPLEITHESHFPHPLKLRLVDKYTCDACDEERKSYVYYCEACQFNLDIICANAARRTLQHKCHRHPLVLDRKRILSSCHACGERHEGMFYRCGSCVFFSIHKDCAGLVDGVGHLSHVGHPLRIVYSDHKRIYNCLLCFKLINTRRNWFYACRGCEFYAHLACITRADCQVVEEVKEEIDQSIPCLPCEDEEYEVTIVDLTKKSYPNEEGQLVHHFGHPEHPLRLQPYSLSEDDPYFDNLVRKMARCNGCTRQISAPMYRCTDNECDFFLHKSCAQVPRYVAHPAHTQHEDLVLRRQPWSETRVFECSCCWEYCNGFSYQCRNKTCEFQVDLECAFLPRTIVHKSHASHPLLLESTTGNYSGKIAPSMKCCASQRGGPMAYRCTSYKCDFKIHVKCALFPGKIWHAYDGDDPFKLTYTHSVLEPDTYYCASCETHLDPKLWFYFSSSCYGQVMHLKCALSIDDCPNLYFKSLVSQCLYKPEVHRHHLFVTPSDMKWCHHCQQFVEPLDHIKDQDVGVAYKCWRTECDFMLQLSCANKFAIMQ
ncbi:hypothetical protein Leryth_012824 [Lithospermum erythrorhizon]|nr:hypothetical protein Leryth_012824 [Lithospermum erythrorhizon]